ncbi:MAG: hypothetical protein LQ348_006015 [Seirophora lacunosa]|nr:MAG: hypothetical protein LQ348_006015 [Seirophora lacunosa]
MSSASIQDLGELWDGYLIASEPDLNDWQHALVEKFVAHILRVLKGQSGFANYAHVLGKGCDGKPEEPKSADQIYLSAAHLRASVRGTPDINVDHIRDPGPHSPDPPDDFFALAQYLLAATTCQTYDYMIKAGCPYGCIVTGEAVVFLMLDEENPTDLHYFLAEPRLDAKSNLGNDLDVSKTMIAQLLSFCLMVYRREKFDQDWIRRAKESTPVWQINYMDVLYETPKRLRETEAQRDQQDLDYQGHCGPHVDRSPVQDTCASTKTDDDDSGSESSDDVQFSDTPCKPEALRRPRGQDKQSFQRGVEPVQGEGRRKSKGQGRQYCTQACLLGLAHRLPIDYACPNAASHPRGKEGDTHALTRPALCRMLRQQLVETMDSYCDNLRLQGSRGMLFRLSLASHGYTFVGKGTISLYTPDLQREGRMYRRLRKFQGRLVPVYLGNIDLDIPWYGLGTEIIHMLLLSYGGKGMPRDLEPGEWRQVTEFGKSIATVGMRHGDLTPLNMLWNEELQRIMFVDFERSVIIPTQRQAPSSKPNPLVKSRGVSPTRKALQELSSSHGQLNMRMTTSMHVDALERTVADKGQPSPTKSGKLASVTPGLEPEALTPPTQVLSDATSWDGHQDTPVLCPWMDGRNLE